MEDLIAKQRNSIISVHFQDYSIDWIKAYHVYNNDGLERLFEIGIYNRSYIDLGFEIFEYLKLDLNELLEILGTLDLIDYFNMSMTAAIEMNNVGLVKIKLNMGEKFNMNDVKIAFKNECWDVLEELSLMTRSSNYERANPSDRLRIHKELLKQRFGIVIEDATESYLADIYSSIKDVPTLLKEYNIDKSRYRETKEILSIKLLLAGETEQYQSFKYLIDAGAPITDNNALSEYISLYGIRILKLINSKRLTR